MLLKFTSINIKSKRGQGRCKTDYLFGTNAAEEAKGYSKQVFTICNNKIYLKRWRVVIKRGYQR